MGDENAPVARNGSDVVLEENLGHAGREYWRGVHVDAITTIGCDPWYAPLRERAAPILAVSREKSAAAREQFVAAGGNEILGVT